MNYAHKEIETLKDGQTKISSDSKHLKDRVDKTQKDFKALEKTIEQMKLGMAEKTNDLERWTRNFSVRIHNIPNLPRYGEPEVYNKIVANILVKNKLVDVDSGAWAPAWTTQNKDLQGGEEGATAQDNPDGHPSPEEIQVRVQRVLKEIEISHPIGLNGNQLIARFHSRPFRNNVLKEARAKLPRGERDIRFVEDLTRRDHELKKRAIPQMQQAFREGKKCRFRNGKLIVNGSEVAID